MVHVRNNTLNYDKNRILRTSDIKGNRSGCLFQMMLAPFSFEKVKNLALPVSAGKPFILRLGLRRRLFNPPQSLVDAARQRVRGVGKGLGVALLFGPGPYLLQPDALPDLGQDVVGVIVWVGGQDSQLGLPQVEAAAFQRGQYFIHGGACCGHSGFCYSCFAFWDL